MNFEEKMGQLESLLGDMESGRMKLDDMITAFEKGSKLLDDCRKDLESIRTRIEKITSSGTAEEVAVDGNGDVKI
ncbi:MAG: exodeoxyribonuclease VII small subunit [Kiritimatiellae bacterium]|nr:exodeoxyribonuclease VII small subunit [Kiritimatiellia bacterium]